MNWWGNEVAAEIKVLRNTIQEYHPKMLISFGGFPFEFLRRVFEIEPQKGPKYWSAPILRNEFEESIKNFEINQANVIPLLRRVIACDNCDKYIETQNHFNSSVTEQYFYHVGAKLSERIIQNKDSLKIWIK